MRVRWRKYAATAIQLWLGYLAGRLIQNSMILTTSPCQSSAAFDHFEVRSPVLEIAENPGKLMIGVMTTHRNLKSRAAAIFTTWGRNDFGLLLFYVGQRLNASQSKLLGRKDGGRNEGKELSQRTQRTHAKTGAAHQESVQLVNNLPVVELAGVDDETYPPRDKSFAMLRHMSKYFGDRYQWFVRADDDVYIRLEELVRVLQPFNVSRPWYIGQPGLGMASERGHLGLLFNRPYCMGGPGVVLSGSSLRQLTPYLQQCDRQAVTSHEDTELGRCLQKHLNISCFSDRKIHSLFRHDSNINYTSIHPDYILPAVSLHPVKGSGSMYKVHVSVLLQMLQSLRRQQQRQESQLAHINRILSDCRDQRRSTRSSARHSDVNDFPVAELLTDMDREDPSMGNSYWGFLSFSLRNWLTGKNLRADCAGMGLRDAPNSPKDSSHSLPFQGGNNHVWDYAVLDKVHFLNPSTAHPFRNRVLVSAGKETLGILKQTLLKPDIRQKKTLSGKRKENASRTVALYQRQTHSGLQQLITVRHLSRFQPFLWSSKFQELQWREIQTVTSSLQETERKGTPSGGLTSSGRKAAAWPDLWVLLPLEGRQQNFPKFMKHLTDAASGYPAPVHLRVALFANLGEYKVTLEFDHSKTVNTTVFLQYGRFSRAVALTTLAKGLDVSSLLIFLDVDMVVTGKFLARVAQNVTPGKAYFPICFSQYAPETVCYRQANCSRALFDFSRDSGFWRDYGFGMVAIMAGDLKKVGGLNTSFVGWGQEDVDFYDRCVSYGFEIHRAVDPGLVHVFHNKTCDSALKAAQRRMCLDSRFSGYGSMAMLSQMATDLENQVS